MKYGRILLKLSGESLAYPENSGINGSMLEQYAGQIIEISKAGCETGVVIGGGNIFRGMQGTASGFDRVKGDQMGMLATIINSLALESVINRMDGKAKVFTSIRMEPVGELYNRDKVTKYMQNGTVCILAGGTGNPFFTTDTAAALRAVEIAADVLLKGTRVDGIYTADPEKDPGAVRYDRITFSEAIEKRLQVMDTTAFSLCRDNNMPIIVFDMNTPGNLKRIIDGKQTGTTVTA
ncbi:MAG: UMP kinase [Bacteroidales bacterium]|jgi:uridylate kinase|nr:UMP kinase [Bacteroidales bacterium]